MPKTNDDPRRSLVWTADHDAAFEQVKRALILSPVLDQFKSAQKTVL